MAGFRRSIWFALGLMIGAIVGGALGLMLASQPGEEMRRWFRTGIGPGVETIRGVATRLRRKEQPLTTAAEEALEAEVEEVGVPQAAQVQATSQETASDVT